MNTKAQYNGAGRHAAAKHMTAQPPADIIETDADYRITVDMPGITQDRIAVRIENRNLELTGTFETLAPVDAMEHPFETLRFQRVFRLGEEVNIDAVKATVKQGELTVVVPKLEQARPRDITIDAA